MIKKGDNVVVIAGKNKGKTGNVMRVLPKTSRVVIEGVNKVTRHVKKTKERNGQKIEFEAPMHISNVMLIDPKTKKRTRVKHSKDEKGKTQRISKKSNTVI